MGRLTTQYVLQNHSPKDVVLLSRTPASVALSALAFFAAVYTPAARAFETGIYELSFHAADYFHRLGVTLTDPSGRSQGGR